MSNQREPRWDHDYRLGQYGENLFATEVIENDEVKTDYQWQETGNLFIECDAEYQGKMQPSGISTTEAKYWVSVCPVGDLPPIIFAFPTSLMKKAVEGKSKIDMNRGTNHSKGYLVKISEIMCIVSEAREKNRKAS